MVDVGDYVQHRQLDTRGEVVQRSLEGWCIVHIPAGMVVRSRCSLNDEFIEEHEKNLIRILGSREVRDRLPTASRRGKEEIERRL